MLNFFSSLAFCLLIIIVAATPSRDFIAGDHAVNEHDIEQSTCPPPRKLDELEELFNARMSLVQSVQQFRRLCRRTPIGEYAEIQALCNNPDNALVNFFVKLNTLPGAACGVRFKSFRYSLTNELIKPNGNVAGRWSFKSCYTSIVKSKEYQELVSHSDVSEIINQLEGKRIQLKKEGETTISCALGRLKGLLSQLAKSDGFIQASVGSLVLMGIVGNLLTFDLLLPLLGAPAMIVGGAIFAVSTACAVGLSAGTEDKRKYHNRLLEQYEFMENL